MINGKNREEILEKVAEVAKRYDQLRREDLKKADELDAEARKVLADAQCKADLLREQASNLRSDRSKLYTIHLTTAARHKIRDLSQFSNYPLRDSYGR